MPLIFFKVHFFLQEVFYFIYYLVGYRLQKVSILTSTNRYGHEPSPSSSRWMFRYYHEAPYGDVGDIALENNVPARFVAVYCAYNEGLTLAEVEICDSRK